MKTPPEMKPKHYYLDILTLTSKPQINLNVPHNLKWAYQMIICFFYQEVEIGEINLTALTIVSFTGEVL